MNATSSEVTDRKVGQRLTSRDSRSMDHIYKTVLHEPPLDRSIHFSSESVTVSP